jgi:hypothetical protein
MCGEECRRRPTGERRLTSQQLVRRTGERVEVCALVDRGIACGLLRRHVRGCAYRVTKLGKRVRRELARLARLLRTLGPGGGGGQRFGNAEIQNCRRTSGEEHVVRLDVAVHDAIRVSILSALARSRRTLTASDNGSGLGQRAARAATRLRRTASRNTEGRRRRCSLAPPRAQHGNDVRMLQPCGELISRLNRSTFTPAASSGAIT